MKKISNRTKKITAVIFALLVWQIAGVLVGHEILLASPVSVFAELARLMITADFWSRVLISTLRIAAGFIIAFTAGLVLAVLADRFEWVKTLVWPFALTIRSVPVASFIVLALIWFKAGRVVSFVCFMASFPVIYNNILEGLSGVDRDLIESAQSLGAGWLRTIRSVSLPEIAPYLTAAVSTGCGTAFKAGAAAEVLAVVSGSIGEQLYMSKVYFETAGLFAWTLVIILLSYAAEKLFILLLNILLRLISR